MERADLLRHLQGLVLMYEKENNFSCNTKIRHLGIIEGILIALGGITVGKPFVYKQKEVTRHYYYVFFFSQRKEMRKETYPEMIIRTAKEYVKEHINENIR